MKKVFNTQHEAESFAKEVKGLVTQSYLPKDVIWTVEWKEEEE